MAPTMTKLVAVGAAVAGVFSLTAIPSSASTFFRATLDSAQEVAPAGATASPLVGSATLELMDLGGGDFSLSYEIILPDGFDYQFFVAGTDFDQIPMTDPLVVTRLHIHNGERGVNGPVVYGLFNPDQDNNDNVFVTENPDGTATVVGSWDAGDGSEPLTDFVDELLAADKGEDVALYFNLHTVGDPAGVIRGQVQAVPAPLGLVLLGIGAIALAATTRRKAS